MRLVHVGNDWRPQGTGGPCQITMWSLEVTDGSCCWEMRCLISLDDLCAHHGYQALGLPRRTPEFPVVAKNDPSVVCCVLREKGCYSTLGKVWVILFDMERAAVRSCARYIDEVNDETDGESIFCDIYPFSPVISPNTLTTSQVSDTVKKTPPNCR
ncbi:hypothetical protein ACP70R_038507 [Stipagrostis hirtigluma subsp. patula]